MRSDLSDSFAVFTFQYQYTGRNVWDLDINSINVALIINTKNTLLSEAIERDDNAKVKFLLANGANPNFRLDRGMTPFLRAACKGNLIVLQTLLENGADVNVLNDDQQTCLILAAMNGQSSVFEELKDAGVPLEQQDRRGWTAMNYAARMGYGIGAKKLLQLGAVIN